MYYYRSLDVDDADDKVKFSTCTNKHMWYVIAIFAILLVSVLVYTKHEYSIRDSIHVLYSPSNRVVLVTSFYNEELLMPYWIQHHAPMFDDVVLIDYHSTDNSVDLIRRLAPKTWKVATSRNQNYGAGANDAEMLYYCNQFGVNDWKIMLTTTEFLVHPNLRQYLSDQRFHVQALRFYGVIMVGSDKTKLGNTSSLLSQRKEYASLDPDAIHYHRFIHRSPYAIYDGQGRHGMSGVSYDYADVGFIAKFQYTPWPEIIPRKLQIQKKIPQFDKKNGFGAQHIVTLASLNSTRLHKLTLGLTNLDSQWTQPMTNAQRIIHSTYIRSS